MTFEELLDQAMAMLQRRGRVTYRALQRQFNLDDDYLADLKAELIEAQRLAVDENGTVLVWTGSATSAPLPTAVPSREAHRVSQAYTPAHLSAKILASRAELTGERKQVTVLFADIKDSTELIRGLDPEAAQQILDPALQRMMDAVHRFEGTVNQVLGDGIMALFGAPIAHEDHALRACYAALAMQAAMRAYTDAVRQAHGCELHIRVGLNSGAVVVRAIGNDLHMDYSAVGETTHLAAGMEQLALPGTIRLTLATLGHERFGVRGLLSVTSRDVLVRCLAELGIFAEAIALGEEAVRIAETGNHPVMLATACVSAPVPYLRQGDFAKAIPLLERGLELCRTGVAPRQFAELAATLGAAYAWAGRPNEALPLLEQAMAPSVLRQAFQSAVPFLWVSEAYRLIGREEDARQLAGHAFEHARDHDERGHQAWARWLLGEIAAHRTPPEVAPAEAAYRQALALAGELGMRPLQAHCHHGLGTLYATLDQQEQTRVELSAAIALYRAMDMQFWLPQAEGGWRSI